MRKYQYQIYYHTSRGRYFIKIRYFLGLVFWLTLRDKYSSNIETFLDKDKAIERAEDYLRYLYLKRKNSRVLKVTGRIDITSRLKSVRDDNEKRILKCQEDNRIWYQIWITQLDMNCIERYFDGYGEVKRWWLRNIMFSFMRRKVVRFEEFLGKIGLRI